MHSRCLPNGSRPARSPWRQILEVAQFFGAWVRNPRGIAAIAPSGRALAALITRDIHAGTGPVLELGAGTGAFAQALVAKGVAETDLTLVEFDGRFAQLLQKRFGQAKVLNMNAAGLAAPGPVSFGAAICGLGLLNMPEPQVEMILRRAFARMLPGGAFYLFTYGRRCSVPQAVLSRLGLRAERTGIAWRNLPPASVYRLERTQIGSR